MRRRDRLPAVLLLLVVAWVAPAVQAAPPQDVFDRWETFDTRNGLPSEKVFAVLVDGSRVWAGTEKGLALIEDGNIRVFGTLEGLPFPAVTALARDTRNGDLWIGTMGGVVRLSGGRFDAFTQLNSGLANNVIYGIAVDGTDVWFATAAGLSHYDSSSELWAIYDTTNTLMHEPWTYGVNAGAGKIYVAVWGGGVIVHDPRSGEFRQHRDPDGEMEIDLFRDDGLVHDVTSSISVSGDLMWVGTYFGLSRYDGRRWRSYSRDDSGLAGDFINYVKADEGSVWIATDQGLSHFDDTTWRSWRLGDGGRFEFVVRDAGGIEQVLRRPSGLPTNVIFGIDLDHENVWLATAKGLVHGIAARPTRTRKETTDE